MGTQNFSLEKFSRHISTSPTSEASFKVFTASPKPPTGSLIIIHGLNLDPARMDDLANSISSYGLNVYRISLSGHKETSQNSNKISKEIWIDELRDLYFKIKHSDGELPISILAYSLGAPLSIQLLEEYPDIKIDHLILLAPAISLKSKTILIRILLPLRYLGLSLPSLSPVNYRYSSTTSLTAYHALFKLYDSSKTISPNSSIRQAKILMLASKKDELIDYTGLKLWANDNKIKNITFEEIIRQEGLSSIPFHLSIDEISLGKSEWNRLIVKINEFLVSRSI